MREEVNVNQGLSTGVFFLFSLTSIGDGQRAKTHSKRLTRAIFATQNESEEEQRQPIGRAKTLEIPQAQEEIVEEAEDVEQGEQRIGN